jgi:hypothetical protein
VGQTTCTLISGGEGAEEAALSVEYYLATSLASLFVEVHIEGLTHHWQANTFLVAEAQTGAGAGEPALFNDTVHSINT